MEEQYQNDNDIDEIFYHIKKLKAEQDGFNDITNDDSESITTTKDITGIIRLEKSYTEIPKEDIFTILKSEENFFENCSKMKVDINSSGPCDICGREIIFNKNLSGLTIRGEFFSCEKCCQDASKETLDSWVDYKQGKPKDIIPIALWLMKENKRTKLFK